MLFIIQVSLTLQNIARILAMTEVKAMFEALLLKEAELKVQPSAS